MLRATIHEHNLLRLPTTGVNAGPPAFQRSELCRLQESVTRHFVGGAVEGLGRTACNLTVPFFFSQTHAVVRSGTNAGGRSFASTQVSSRVSPGHVRSGFVNTLGFGEFRTAELEARPVCAFPVPSRPARWQRGGQRGGSRSR